MIKLKVKKGDEVVIITGKYKGKKGKVLKVFPEENTVVVSGVNLVKKHTKPNKMSEGGIITQESPIHISNIAHIDPKTGNPTKVAFKFLEDGSKVRVAKKSGEIIGKVGNNVKV
ncbi:50S ribosomal protein L24 [Rickettsia prowazekii]|uniref:Large ribosomal subunit protein uL24 n=2 Tax=Rickettsia prowazekii TaxID=782 RepID=RL24_RICPR|nr:50S ribosomal protein L24 [Rickettsia prowazekii]Q9ZCR6.1 RecName: Full=Large ribosomal subunit protein uL24; AltName: Full=50S ribosomal protein L24 [Rickettsia prowazekii str. Madrid E]EOB10624.1 50S ribosomal protein L24 [Rickettsia prowazekii str. GvF12]ADE30191.1 50S ribosomal protein L24 [Rickettsia prowazekii str. Rp22]AFE49448.1 50S ribosomal protein L24 [Rickettsia prowazekii str. Chernikova]AFE50292.1 50S ribosomal protein L24 [Rickettsia prowazekii str. Katsinyian]AFE51138.1 50S